MEAVIKKQSRKVGVAGGFFNQMMGNNSTVPVVGQGATELHYSDRTPYQVIEVSEDGNHAIIEEYDAKIDPEYLKSLNGRDCMGHQNWVYEPNGRKRKIEWRRNKWCSVGEQIVFIKSVRDAAEAAGFSAIARYLSNELRVLNHQEIIYEGFSPEVAVNVYNGITGKSDVGVKIEN